MKDLYSKNFKSLKKEIKEDIRRWKDHTGLWISKIIIVKMDILTKINLLTQFISHQKSQHHFQRS